jgi:hypothetical protein
MVDEALLLLVLGVLLLPEFGRLLAPLPPQLLLVLVLVFCWAKGFLFDKGRDRPSSADILCIVLDVVMLCILEGRSKPLRPTGLTFFGPAGEEECVKPSSLVARTAGPGLRGEKDGERPFNDCRLSAVSGLPLFSGVSLRVLTYC